MPPPKPKMNTLEKLIFPIDLRAVIRWKKVLDAQLQQLVDAGKAEAARQCADGAFYRALDIVNFHYREAFATHRLGDWGLLGEPEYIKVYDRIKEWREGWLKRIRRLNIPESYSILDEKYYFRGQELATKPC